MMAVAITVTVAVSTFDRLDGVNWLTLDFGLWTFGDSWLPFAICHLPFAIRHLPFATRHSPLATRLPRQQLHRCAGVIGLLRQELPVDVECLLLQVVEARHAARQRLQDRRRHLRLLRDGRRLGENRPLLLHQLPEQPRVLPLVVEILLVDAHRHHLVLVGLRQRVVEGLEELRVRS